MRWSLRTVSRFLDVCRRSPEVARSLPIRIGMVKSTYNKRPLTGDHKQRIVDHRFELGKSQNHKKGE